MIGDNKFRDKLIRDDRTQAIFHYGDSILERVFVETPVDTDGDGRLDLVAVYIRRPKETLEGLKVPAIYVANPYMLHCNEDWYVPHEVDQELGAFEEQDISWEDVSYDFSQDRCAREVIPRVSAGVAETSPVDQPDFEAISDAYSYFVCRGYASVFCGGLGTKDSQGFTLTGSQEEILAFRSVIDWLCGRGRAFTNQTDNIEIHAHWCTGKVAMTGKSYLGTMCIGVAMTGVPGLETIIPEAAISNWYAYYRTGGLVVPALDWQGDDLDILAKYCFSRALDPEDYAGVKDAFGEKLSQLLAGEDRESGNYNRFWDERNYLNQIDCMKASALIIHGINDWNVKMNQCIPLWEAMRHRGLPVKMLLHQGDHIYIYNLEGSPALDAVHRWLDCHLYGLENGVMEQLADVTVQSNTNPDNWMTSKEFPPEGTGHGVFPISAGTRVERPYALGSETPELGTNTFTDDLAAAGYLRGSGDLKQWQDGLVLPDTEGRPWCLKYVWDPFASGELGEGCSSLRISGTPQISFSASVDRDTGILSVMLVEYGQDRRLTVKQAPTGSEKRSWGPGAPEYEEVKFLWEGEDSPYRIISRGHINGQNWENSWRKRQIRRGEWYRYQISMVPTDFTLEKGKRLGLLFYGADAAQTLRPASVTQVAIQEDTIQAFIPFLPIK